MTITQASAAPAYNLTKAILVNARMNMILPICKRRSVTKLHQQICQRRKQIALRDLRSQIAADIAAKKTPEMARWDEIEFTPSRNGGWNGKTKG